MNTKLVWWGAAVGCFVLDIATRQMCFRHCLPHTGGGFGLHPFANYGFAFSVPMPQWSLYVLYALALATICVFLWRQWRSFFPDVRMAWLLVGTGAAGNAFDRFTLGYVRDFIQIGTGFLNMGDLYIIVGVVYLLYVNSRQRTRSRGKGL